MPVNARRDGSPVASRVAVGTFGLAMLAAAGVITLPVAGAPPSRERTEADKGVAHHEWTLVQVQELIEAIAEARDHGLDPSDYGLAALRGEMELCRGLWRTQGSRQLDTLARSAALALASDYRDPDAPRHIDDEVLASTLDQARRSGRLRQWFSAQRAAA
jgi:hypothetical protein